MLPSTSMSFGYLAMAFAFLLACLATTTQGQVEGDTRLTDVLKSRNDVNSAFNVCDLCSEGKWCAPWCVDKGSQSGFKRRARPSTRQYRPFNDALGNLSFDDYLFLRMLGRSRK